MEDKREKRSGGGALIVAAIGLPAMLLVLYVLSSGPTIWLTQQGYLSSELDNAIYTPLEWACDNCPPLRDATGWYYSLFYRE